MLVSDNKKILARARTMRLHGIDRDVFNRFTNTKASWIYDIIAPGFKYNMTDIASAIGIVQLKRCEAFGLKRQQLAARYNNAFANLPVFLPPGPAQGDTHSWHLYLLQMSDGAPIDRDSLISILSAADIGTSVHYRPLSQMTFWKDFCRGQKFPNADNYFDRCITLPLFMDMSENEQDYVIETVHRALR